jgi:hypothetical protein
VLRADSLRDGAGCFADDHHHLQHRAAQQLISLQRSTLASFNHSAIRSAASTISAR